MLDLISTAIREQFQNQVVAGGLVLGLMGLILASLRNLPLTSLAKWKSR